MLFYFRKPSLARLGETHCSHCHPERETALSYGTHHFSLLLEQNFKILMQNCDIMIISKNSRSYKFTDYFFLHFFQDSDYLQSKNKHL